MKQTHRFLTLLSKTYKGVCCGIMLLAATGSSGQGFHLGLTLSPNVGFGVPRGFSHEALRSSSHFGYGFIFDAKFTDTYAIGTGVNVFHTGGVISYFEATETGQIPAIQRVELAQRLQYVEVPLTFKMRTKEIGYTTYWGQFGLGLGLNVRAEGKASRTTVALQDSLQNWVPVLTASELPGLPLDVDLTNQTRLFRPALIVGLGLERRFTGTTALALGIRYNMGIRNQYEDFEVIQGTVADGVLYHVDEGTTQTRHQGVNMSGKSGQLELMVGLMF